MLRIMRWLFMSNVDPKLALVPQTAIRYDSIGWMASGGISMA